MTAKVILCASCGPGRLQEAGLIYRRKPGREDVTACEFCRQKKLCRCWEVRIGGVIGKGAG